MVYGAGSKVGRAFCKYLGEHGFGLILVDFNFERMRQTEMYLQEKVKRQLLCKMIVVKSSVSGITPEQDSDGDQQMEESLS